MCIEILPSRDYVTFENNSAIFKFNCSGNGSSLFWDIDGHPTGSPYVLNKGIRATPYISSPDGLIVSSKLIVPTTKANNNITVMCTVGDSSFNFKSSVPVKLFLQGGLMIALIHRTDGNVHNDIILGHAAFIIVKSQTPAQESKVQGAQKTMNTPINYTLKEVVLLYQWYISDRMNHILLFLQYLDTIP